MVTGSANAAEWRGTGSAVSGLFQLTIPARASSNS